MSDDQTAPADALVPVIPYATPMVMRTTGDVWQEGTTIIARKNAVLPPRCVKCNAPVVGEPVKRTYYWHHPGIFAVILVNLLVYAIVALVVRKKGIIHYFVCPKHRQRRQIGLLLGWVGGLGGAAMLIAGAANSSGELAIVGAVVFIVGIVGGIRARLLYPKKIDDHFLWLAGGGREFVASLSGVPEAPPLPPAYPYAGAPTA